MSAATIESAILLLEFCDSSLPRARDVEVLTSGDSALLLVSPVPLTQQHVWLKRITPKFDRKFLKCRVNNPGVSGPLYSLTITDFAEWNVITDRLHQNLLQHRPQIRPSSTQCLQRSVKKHEQSLMPFLSAIGLAVVYACNLPW